MRGQQRMDPRIATTAICNLALPVPPSRTRTRTSRLP